MLRGSFEGEDTSDGRRIYRLRWKSKDEIETPESQLSESELRAGMFIRYLIGQGKISER